MNKNIFKNQSGSLLLETLLSLNMLVILLISFSIIFLSMLHNYLLNLYQIELRAQMRFALECLSQDIKYADKVQIFHENGHDVIYITTRATAEQEKTIIKYYQDDLAYYPRILKNAQPLTGDNIDCHTSIRFTCQPLNPSADNRVFLLELKGSQQAASSKYFYLQTAVIMLQKPSNED